MSRPGLPLAIAVGILGIFAASLATAKPTSNGTNGGKGYPPAPGPGGGKGPPPPPPVPTCPPGQVPGPVGPMGAPCVDATTTHGPTVPEPCQPDPTDPSWQCPP